MKSLQEIYKSFEHLTDKGNVHSYLETYDTLLSPYRRFPIRLVEIGVYKGGSIAMWAEYFAHPETKIIGVDMKDEWEIDLSKDSRIKLVWGNAYDPKTLEGMMPVDVVIDDGSHTLSDQQTAFHVLFPKLRPCGIYIIEGIQTDAALTALMKIHPFQIVDLRGRKNRYDDLLLIARRPG